MWPIFRYGKCVCSVPSGYDGILLTGMHGAPVLLGLAVCIQNFFAIVRNGGV